MTSTSTPPHAAALIEQFTADLRECGHQEVTADRMPGADQNFPGHACWAVSVDGQFPRLVHLPDLPAEQVRWLGHDQQLGDFSRVRVDGDPWTWFHALVRFRASADRAYQVWLPNGTPRGRRETLVSHELRSESREVRRVLNIAHGPDFHVYDGLDFAPDEMAITYRWPAVNCTTVTISGRRRIKGGRLGKVRHEQTWGRVWVTDGEPRDTREEWPTWVQDIVEAHQPLWPNEDGELLVFRAEFETMPLGTFISLPLARRACEEDADANGDAGALEWDGSDADPESRWEMVLVRDDQAQATSYGVVPVPVASRLAGDLEEDDRG
ncbi:hypothetical protein [Streptacidiphilus cavernicola]|uniref:Uncharacterized protein n=1 Tax=Streptacidiphilus cavernicola TaxID=3342716 RepID=A0ABV6W245_9ACTN